MSRRAIYLRRLFVGSLLLATLVLFSGCSSLSSAQNTLSPAGTVADRQRDLFIMVVWPAAAILVLVEGLILFIVIKFRRQKGDDAPPRQVHGNTLLEIAWTIAPAILLAIIAVPTLAGVVELGRGAKSGATNVKVTGAQWVWQFAYPDLKDNGGNPIEDDLNTLHIPVNREVGFTLGSADVIHSFWIPRLAGKTDVIPNRQNHMWLKATETGTYSGQCAEFCGRDHAIMRFQVIVQSQDEFDAWAASKGATNTTAQQ